MAIRLYGPDGKIIHQPGPGEWATWQKDIRKVFQLIFDVMPNPDPILRKTGKTIEVYSEVKRDPDVWAVLSSRKAGVLSKPWDVIPASDDSKDREVADFVRENLRRLELYKDLEQMLEALTYGYSVMEIIWEQRDGKWWIADLKSRSPRRFTFDADGNLRLLTTKSPLSGEKVPPYKFIVVKHEDDDDDNIYGVSLMSIVYWPWFFMKMDFKFWAIAIERGGMPMLIGRYPPGTPQSEKDEFFNFLKNAVQDAVLMLSERFQVDSVDISGKIETIYRTMIEVCQQRIHKAILGQTLTTQMGTTGSYAAARVHMGVRQDLVEHDALMLMSAIQKQLIAPLVLFNFDVEYLPRFVIDYQEEDVRLEFARRDAILQKMGYPITKQYISEKYNIPLPSQEEEVLFPPTKDTLPFVQEESNGVTFSRDEQRAFLRADALERFHKKTLRKGEVQYQNLADWFIKKIKKFKRPEDVQHLMDIFQEEILNALAETQRDAFFTAYLIGQADIHEEIAQTIEMASIELEPLPFVEAIDFFRKKIPMTPEQIDSLSRLYDDLYAKYFTLSGFESLNLIARVKNALEKMLSEGKTLKDFQDEVEVFFYKAGITRNAPWRIETVFRTNIQQAYHAGAWDRLQDPSVKTYFPFYQYLTVGDDRVRPAHAAMHGKIYRADDPIWRKWWPPNGFNCRCTVRPISKYEASRRGLKPHAYPSEGIEPDSGFDFNPSIAFRRLQEISWSDEITNIGPYGCEEVSFIERIVQRRCKPFENLPRTPFPEEMNLTGDDLERYIRSLEGKYRTPLGIYVEINIERLLRRVTEDRKRFLSLLVPTVTDPVEIWMGEKSKEKGVILRFLNIFEDPKKEIVYIVIVDVEKFMNVITTIPVDLKRGMRGGLATLNLKHLERRIRSGELLYTKG